MNDSTTKPVQRRFSPHAALAALGLRVRQLNLFGPIQEQVKIEQKVVKHTPIQKLYDGFITILAGAHGLVEINKRLRNDPARPQAAFGRGGCAEQSVVQETLDACTTVNVGQIHQAMDAIYRQHSQGYRHDYAHWQLLDIDITGLPLRCAQGKLCGARAAFASRGEAPPRPYFAAQQMLTQLNALAHNTIVWARGWLAPHCPKLRHWGMLRMVRDVFQVSGLLVFDSIHGISHIWLNQSDPLARGSAVALRALLASKHVAVSLGET